MEKVKEVKEVNNNQYVRGNVYDFKADAEKKMAVFSVKVENTPENSEKYGDTYIKVYANDKKFDKAMEMKIEDKQFIEVEGQGKFSDYDDKDGNKNKSNSISMYKANIHDQATAVKKDFLHYNPNVFQAKVALGLDVVVNKTANGKEVGNLVMGNNVGYKTDEVDKKGDPIWENTTNWINASVFENKNLKMDTVRDLKKGQVMSVEGVIKNTHYKDKNGNKRYTVKMSVMKANTLEKTVKKEKVAENAK
jgi:single-stranded DNA-binding protein